MFVDLIGEIWCVLIALMPNFVLSDYDLVSVWLLRKSRKLSLKLLLFCFRLVKIEIYEKKVAFELFDSFHSGIWNTKTVSFLTQ